MNEPRQLNRQRVLSNYEFNPQSICDFNVTKTRDSTTELEPFLSRCGEYDKKIKSESNMKERVHNDVASASKTSNIYLERIFEPEL